MQSEMAVHHPNSSDQHGADLPVQSGQLSQQWHCLWPAETKLGEGPLWWKEHGSLLFIDIKQPAILLWHPDGRTSRYPIPAEIGCIAHRRRGGLVAALRDGLFAVTLDPLHCEPLLPLEETLPGNRFNDGKCDPMGRLWVASMDDQESQPTGAIWRISADGSATRMAGGFVVGNGFGWSPDGTVMYFTDSSQRCIYAYAFDMATGNLGERRVFATVDADAGYPDGLTVDSQGGVWSAHWDGWRVTRYRPDGCVDRVIPLPVPRPTSLTFGGDHLERLFVTSASIHLTPEQRQEAPLSGALFEIKAGVCGLADNRFSG